MPLLHPGEETAAPEPGRRFERHHHLRPYAALIIRGSCEEAGDRGRLAGGVGDVFAHAAFDGHADTISPRGAAFINFPLDGPFSRPFGRVADVDSIIRTYRQDPAEAAAMLIDQFEPVAVAARDWPDELAHELGAGDHIRLDHWAEVRGLHPTSISRSFKLAYGVSPKRYRLEKIASRAARRLSGSQLPLSTIAAECGFADQSHMTRSLCSLFGATPRQLRAR